MRKALLTMLMGVALSTMVAGYVFAESVYITKSGKKYHHAESRFIKNREGVKEMTLEEAQAKGFEPARDYLLWKKQLEESGTAKKQNK